MLTYLGKNLTWIITSFMGLVLGISGAMLSSSTSASSAATNGILDKFPQVRIHPLPHHPPPAVPEVSTGLVLLPIVLAILLFASRHLLSQRSVENQ
jgi:hypothetical protein